MEMAKKEYIEREALLRYLNDIWLTATPTDLMPDDDRQLAIVRCMGLNDAMDAVKSIPAADVRHVEWIPVKERLPDQNSGSLYICLIVGGEYDQLSWYELCDFAEGQFWIKDELYEGHVTHWMPLPQAPKEERA